MNDKRDETFDELFGTGRSLSDYQLLVTWLQQLAHVVLYEGLSSQITRHYSEQPPQGTILIRRNRFYAEPQALRQEDFAKLQFLCSEPKNFPLGGTYGFCAFHADYCLASYGDDVAIYFQFDFKCSAIQAYRGTQELYVRLMLDQFEPILTSYHKNRPSE